MHLTKFTTGAAVLLALAPTAFAAGMVHIVNNCGKQLYYSSVGAGGSTNMQPLPSGYSQPMSGSVSIKIAPNQSGPVTQLEFTMTGSSLAYDMSNIDGNPFAASGMSLVPSSGATTANPTCLPVVCAAGDAVCTAAYNQPNDVRTLVCGPSVDLTLTVCTGGHAKREDGTVQVQRVHARHLPKLA